MDSMAIWNKFTETGKVEDYLYYRKTLRNVENNIGESNENEHRGTDSQRTEYS